jgi:adenylyltransferase/sulfurtransferase
MRFRELKLRRNVECPVCGDNPSIHELIDYHQFCGVPNPAEVVPVAEQQAQQQGGYMSDTEIDAVALKARLDRGDKFQFIDVREPNEYQIASIPGARLIPLGDIPKRVGELDPNTEVIVHCKMGGRSAKAAEFLRQSGFKNVKNMLGGITAWSDKIDPSVPKY